VAAADTLRFAEDGVRTAVARGSLLDLEDGEMMLGTTLFFFPHGTEERERAGAHLYRYRELAQQTNDHVFQIDAAGMLSTWHRLRGDVDHARRYAQEALSLAPVSQVVKYRAEARGNAAWAAWRAGDRTGARTEAGAALDDFEARSPRSPFEWTARWPVLALSAANGDLRHATRQARAMLAPLQQKMPDDLEELARSFSDQQALGLPEAECSLESLMALARSYGYL